MVVIEGRNATRNILLSAVVIILVAIAVLCINQGIIIQLAGEALLAFILYLIGVIAFFTAYRILMKVKKTIEVL